MPGPRDVVDPERVLALRQVVVHEDVHDGASHGALEHFLVLSVAVRTVRADLDLDPEELGICVDDQRADPVAEIEQHGLRADLRRVMVMMVMVMVVHGCSDLAPAADGAAGALRGSSVRRLACRSRRVGYRRTGSCSDTGRARGPCRR